MTGERHLRVLLLSDTKGNDDEGMKKIARKISLELNGMDGIYAEVVTPREASKYAGSFDIFHYIGGPTYRSALLSGFIKSRNSNLHTILTFTNPFWGMLANLVVRVFRPDHVIVASNFWCNWAKQKKLNYSMFSISGVDLERFTPVEASRCEELRLKLNLPLNTTIALHVGHLKHDRNLLSLLEAQKEPDIQVVIVGSTTTVQDSELVTELKNAGCIVVDTYQEKIQEFYQAADCYVFPTIDSKAAVQVPLSVLEAMAVNLPVVSTPFGGLPSIFGNEETVFFISEIKISSEQLIEAIKRAINSSLNTREIVAEHSWPSIALKLRTLYQEIVFDNGS